MGWAEGREEEEDRGKEGGEKEREREEVSPKLLAILVKAVLPLPKETTPLLFQVG